MEKRINWKDGMEISPEVFTLGDECHYYMVGLMGKVLASERRGILEGAITINPEKVSVSRLFALAVDGTIVQVEEIEASLSTKKDGYIVIRQEGTTEIEQKGIPYITPQYKCCCISDIQNSDIIIGKIQNQRIKDSYIPPCYTIDAYPGLHKLCGQCGVFISAIKSKMVSKDIKGDTTMLELLTMELNNFSLKESPKELYMILNKITYCLNKLHPATTRPEITSFDNMDMAESLIPLRDYLMKYSQALDNIVEKKNGREYDV